MVQSYASYVPSLTCTKTDRLYRGVCGSDWFLEQEKKVKEYYGKDDIVVVAVWFSYDKTHLGRIQSSQSVTPLYISVANIDNYNEQSIRCVGFFPETEVRTLSLSKITESLQFVQHTPAQMNELLRQNNVKGKKFRSNLIKYTNLLVEQTFLSSMMKEVNDCSVNGGFYSWIGSEEGVREMHHIVPVIAGFPMDNQVQTTILTLQAL